jgi:pyridoxal phosphate enzyme (YggS family)|tara:strand:- start:14045 stop:14695 length:651 start_codon:yes stop_codon:yes gene_type:complete
VSITKNLINLKKNLPSDIELIVVSKTRSNEEILEAYNTGHINFGENKVQELVNKHENLPKEIKWHMIGHLQSNKVKYIAKFIDLIHTVDSVKILKEINKRAKIENRIIDCLLQIKIAIEENKFGFNFKEIDEVIAFTKELKNIKIRGVMGMATNTDNSFQIKSEFDLINDIYKKYYSKNFNILSIGMSSDYNIAVSKNSNMVRIGSAIFGKRIKNL